MRQLLRLGLIAAATLLVGCGPSAPSVPASNASPNGNTAASKPSGASGAASAPAASGPSSAMVQAAAQEGTLELYTPSSLEKTAAAEIIDAFNRHYGLHVDFNYTPSGSMTRDAARV